MSLVRWNPINEFDNFFRGVPALNEPVTASRWNPAVDVAETDEAFRIDIDLPAVARDDISVSVNDGLLTVSGERKEVVDEGEKRHRVERRYGTFVRTFRLPESADEERVDATSRDGVLSITIAKLEKAGPKQIEVKVH